MGQNRALTQSVGPKVEIHILRGKAASKSREMRGPTLLIGSGPHCDIQMRSADVALKHCLVSRESGRVSLRRLDGDFPIYVNGGLCDESILRDGDIVRVGPFELRVALEEVEGSVVESSPRVAEQPTLSAVGAMEAADPIARPAPAESALYDRAVVDGARGDLDRRGRELEELAASLKLREDALRSAEEALSRSRLQITDEILGVDSQREKNAKQCARLVRATQRIAAKHRERLQSVASLANQVRERETVIEPREQFLDRREDQLRRWEEDLTRIQAETTPLQAELASRVEELEARRAEFLEERKRLDLDVENLKVRERGVERLREDVDARRQRLAEDESSLKARRELVDAEATRVLSQADELTAKAQDLDQRAHTLSKQEEYLRRTAQEVEQSRLAVREQSEAAAAQWEVVQESRRRLEETQRQSEALALQAGLLDSRSCELELQSKAIEEQRLAVAEAKLQIDDANADLSRREQALEQMHSQAAPAFARLRELEVSLAQREESLATRERDFESLQAEHAGRQTALEIQARILDEQSDQISQRREDVDDLLTRTQQRAGELALDSAKLESMADELKQRQSSLGERERLWCDSLHDRRREIESLADDVREKRRLLDRQAVVHRRRLDRLREVGLKVLSRRKESSSHLERLEQRHEAYRRRLEKLQADQRDLLEAVVQFADHAAQREAHAIHRIETVRMENQQLARLQDSVREHAEAILSTFRALPVVGAGDGSRDAAVHSLVADQRQAMVEEVQRALDEWSSLLTALREALASRESEMNARESDFGVGKELLEQLLSLAARCASASTWEEDAAEPTAEESSLREPDSAMDDALLRDRILACGLLPSEKLAEEEAAARACGVDLGGRLVSKGVLTPYQLECLREDRSEDLRLGPIDVLDVLHAGVLATTYRVRAPHSEESLALRLLESGWRVDAAMKGAMESAVGCARSLRHPHIAAVKELVEWEGRFGFVSEFVEGTSLRSMDVRSTTLEQQISYCRQTLDALTCAEDAGVRHLALRPSRIMVTAEDGVSLLGFGEPSWLQKIHRCERGKAIAAYLAPEAATLSDDVDGRADLFSVGAVFTELRRRSPAPPAELAATANAYDHFLSRLMQTNPRDRFAAASQALEALVAVAEGTRQVAVRQAA